MKNICLQDSFSLLFCLASYGGVIPTRAVFISAFMRIIYGLLDEVAIKDCLGHIFMCFAYKLCKDRSYTAEIGSHFFCKPSTGEVREKSI